METKLEDFKKVLNTYDKKIGIHVVYHGGGCSDGNYGVAIAIEGLKSKYGFVIKSVFGYIHGTDLFEKEFVPKLVDGDNMITIDVVPSVTECKMVLDKKCNVSVIDHHPLKPEQQKIVGSHFNWFIDTDKAFSATTLCCIVFDPELLKNPLIDHIRKFDNQLLDDPITRTISCYNKRLKNYESCFKSLKRSLEDIVSLGKMYELEERKKVYDLARSGENYNVKVPDETDKAKHTEVKVYEVVIDDEFLPMMIANEFYKVPDNRNTVLITICDLKHATKLSFRSFAQSKEPHTARTLACLVGGGGHKDSSAHRVDRSIKSYRELL